MQVMDPENTVHFGDIADHLFQVHIARRRLEQDLHRLLQDTPGVVQDQETDQHTDKRIEPVGAGEKDEDTGNHRADRGDDIAHQVDERRAQVEVALAAAVDQHCGHQIDHNRDQPYTDEDA